MRWQRNVFRTILRMTTLLFVLLVVWNDCDQGSQMVAHAFSAPPVSSTASIHQKQQRYYHFSTRKIKQFCSSSQGNRDQDVGAITKPRDDATSFDHASNVNKENDMTTQHDQDDDNPVQKKCIDNNDRDNDYAIAKTEEEHLPGEEAISKILSRAEVELVEALLVIVSTILVAFSTIPRLDAAVYQSIETAQVLVNYIFCIEFALRFYVNIRTTGVGKYLTKPLVLIDIVVIILPSILLFLPFSLRTTLPSWCTSTGGLQNLRLLRILRLQRLLVDIETFTNFQTALGFQAKNGNSGGGVKSYQLQLARVVLSLFTLLSVASGLIYTAEHRVNPDIPDYFTALYFGLTTLTTVGFGDIKPVTWEGKLVVCGSILAGVTIIPAQAAVLVEALLEYENEKINAAKGGGADAATLSLPIERKGGNKNSIDNNNNNNGGLIDAVTPCSTCGSTMHWSEAKFCWSCGAELDLVKEKSKVSK